MIDNKQAIDQLHTYMLTDAINEEKTIANNEKN